MSITFDDLTNECPSRKGQCSAIELIIEPREKDLGGFSVRRVLPVAQRQMVGPWIFFDHMGPACFSAGTGINVRPHPHINLATVTYLFEGEIFHRDSLGFEQPIRPGAINLMVAGKGIVHSERERAEVHSVDHKLHGLQLWLALPEEDEECEPAFYHYDEAAIPSTNVGGIEVRVMMGTAYGVTSPVKTFAETLYLEALLKEGQSLKLPESEERAVYVVSGGLLALDSPVSACEMAIFSPEPGVEITATEDSRIAVIGGETMQRRHMFWNFVSSRAERIEKAKIDWKTGHFPKIVAEGDEFIPLPVD